MKKRFSIFYCTITSGMVGRKWFTGWFDQAFLHQVIRGAWGLGFYDFYRLSDGEGVVERRIT